MHTGHVLAGRGPLLEQPREQCGRTTHSAWSWSFGQLLSH